MKTAGERQDPAALGGSTSTVTLGAWNLEWFGTPGKRGLWSQRPRESLEAIAGVIAREKRPGVMILNEINVRSAEWLVLQQLLLKEGYQVVQPLGAASEQETVLLFDTKRVKPLGSSAYVPQPSVVLGACRSTPRSPVVGGFQVDSFDFTVVGVHLRADGDRGCGGEVFRDHVRRAESNALMDYLVSHQRAKMVDADVLLLGDLNVEPSDPSVSPLIQRNMQVLTVPARMAEGSGRWSYRRGGYRHALDHVLVSPPAEREYVPRSAEYPAGFSQMSEAELEKFRRYFSDHAPVWARFRTDLGDDD